MTGQTTTGSIDAKLTIDKSEWDRSVAEAKAEARELGDLHPDVKIDANVGAALAKLDEVLAAVHRIDTSGPGGALLVKVDAKVSEAITKIDALSALVKKLDTPHNVVVDAQVAPAVVKIESTAAALKRLEAAELAAANSASTAYIAQMRLEEVQKKGGASALQLAAAEEAVARANRNAEAAEKRHLAAVAALNAAKAEAVRKSLEQASANEVEAKSSNNAARSNNQRVSGLQVLLGLAPAILAAAAPIAGAAVGLGVGFGVMGIAGVLAFKGIKDAMVVGDGVGNQYAAGLQGLKGDMNALAGTSANAMLSSFNQIVGDINTRMPYLHTMIGEGSVALGQMGGTALRGVLDGLQTMNPLLQAGQVELGKFVTWLFSFNGTSGFQSFIAYSVNNLPSVMHLLENLVITAGHILSAFAPLGPVMITMLTGLTDGLNALPLPVLAGLVTSATLLGPALKTAFAPGVAALIVSVAESIGFTGVMANLAVPVVGILTALIAGIGVAAAASAMSTGTGTAALVDYGNAVERDNGLIGENIRLQAAHAATTKEMRDAAESLGISTQTVIQAMLGDHAAQTQVNDVMSTAIDRRQELRRGDENLTDTSLRLKAAKDTLSGGIGANSSAITNNIDAYKAYKDAVETGTSVTSAHSAALQLQAGQYGTTVAAIASAQAAQDKTGQSTADTTIKMQLQNDAAGILKMTLDGLNGKAISAAQAQNAFDSSIANMGDHVSATGKKITFTTTSIGDMSAASVALRGQLNTQVTGLQAVVEANGGLDESTGKAKAQMEAMRTQIIENAVAHGVDRDAVTAYVDNLLTIPKSIPPTKIDVDTAAAIANIESFKGHLASIQDRLVTVTERTLKDPGGMGSSIGGRENGSLAGGAATGGLIHAGFSATSPAYLAGGGSPFVPRGVDVVPAMLEPGEVVMKRASARALGTGNLLEANRTGQWPGQAQGSGGGVHVGQITINDQHDPVGTSADVQRRLAMLAT